MEKLLLLAVLGVVALSLLKSVNSVNVNVVRVAVLCIALVGILPQVTELISLLKSINISDNVSTQGLKILFKVFLILTVGAISADICRDNGEGAIASVVEITTKITAISLCIPVITAVISVAVSFLG